MIFGICVGAVGLQLLLPTLRTLEWWPGHTTHNHDTEYHIHADFLIVLQDTILDLSDTRYMTTATETKHADVHLHDHDGEVVHYHAAGISFADFLRSLDITLTDTCLTVSSTTVCTSETDEIALFVNDQKYTDPILEYIPTDLDRVLLYAGTTLTEPPLMYLSQVGDRSCMFSGSCPERGTPPPESCGLTCEL